ncbi:MAG: dihydroneopterin aldolase [Verrucomicrobiota bacterium]|nr:dihydroneopterin aldolase [Verrucomicrobiota bacterium]
MGDAILIEQLELQARLGVTDAERANDQRITISLRLEPDFPFAAIKDDIRQTINYAKVCERVKAIVAARPRSLIETLAEEIASELLRDFPLRSIEIELRKYVLPDTKFVAVKIRRPVQN